MILEGNQSLAAAASWVMILEGNSEGGELKNLATTRDSGWANVGAHQP